MSKIKRLIIKNALGIQELAINPGKVNIISGGNEKGKTSILEAIEKALYNTQRRAKFVRTGADSAFVEVQTDDGLTVQRTIFDDTDGVVKVTAPLAGSTTVISKPETFLKELFGVRSGNKKADVFAFNPVDFMAKKDTEQTDILLSLLPINVTQEDARALFGIAPQVDYNKHGLQVVKELEKFWYEARREANAAVKATKSEAEAIGKRLPDNYRPEDWEEIKLSDLYGDVRDAEAVNLSRERAQEFIDKYPDKEQAINNKYALEVKEAEEINEFRLGKARDDIAEQVVLLEDEITAVEEQIKEFEKVLIKLKAQRDSLNTAALTGKQEALDRELQATVKQIDIRRKAELDALSAKSEEAKTYLVNHDAIDIKPLQIKAEHTEEMQRFIPLAKERKIITKRLLSQEETAFKYNLNVELCRQKPAEMLAKVELPVKGLGIDDSGMVTIDDLPLRNMSTSKQVRVCLDIARAYAKDNPLKLVCVDKLEHLDADVRAEFLKQIEADNDYQYFVTLVTAGDLKIETKGA